MTLDKLTVGCSAEIVKIDPSNPNLSRLSELGVIAGQKVKLLRKAPLGDPLQIRIMNYELCLKKQDAAGIIVYAGEEKQTA